MAAQSTELETAQAREEAWRLTDLFRIHGQVNAEAAQRLQSNPDDDDALLLLAGSGREMDSLERRLDELEDSL